jgi:hypothetical protein
MELYPSGRGPIFGPIAGIAQLSDNLVSELSLAVNDARLRFRGAANGRIDMEVEGADGVLGPEHPQKADGHLQDIL